MAESVLFRPVREYRELRYDFRNKFGYYPQVREAAGLTQAVWSEWEGKLFSLVRPDVPAGWEVDPEAWGPTCIRSEHARGGIGFWGFSEWMLYVFGSMLTAGLGLFFLPFVIKVDILYLKGADIRLRRTAKP